MWLPYSLIPIKFPGLNHQYHQSAQRRDDDHGFGNEHDTHPFE
jgi:hypothetical protein